MKLLFLTLCVGLPPWAEGLDIQPKTAPTIGFDAGSGPVEALVLPSKTASRVSVEGPATVELMLYGISVKRRRTGRVEIYVDADALETVKLSTTPLPVRVPGWRRRRLTEGRMVSIKLGDGSHIIELRPSRTGRVGFALTASVTKIDRPTADSAENLVNEPPLIGRGFEPEIVSEVQAESVTEVTPGFEIIRGKGRSHTVQGATGAGMFLVLQPGQNLGISARGTGVLVFDFHAHRDSTAAPTLEPAILAVLLNDVLVKTLKVDDEIDESFSVEGASYQLSGRTRFQVNIPPGVHRVQITLSDNALAGGSLKVRFETAKVIELSDKDAPTPPEAPPLIEIRDQPDEPPPGHWLGFSIGAGASLNNSSAQLGVSGLAEIFFMPADFDRRFGAGFTSGFSTTRTSESVADRRSPAGTTSVSLTERVVPLLLDLRTALPLSDNFVLMLSAGGGGLIASAETEALDSSIRTGTEWVWAATTQGALMMRTGDGWLALRAQWIGTQPRDIANLRDYDAGLAQVALSYTFSNQSEL